MLVLVNSLTAVGKKDLHIVFTFTSQAIHVTELVATATVALVGAVHVGTLLTARVAVALVQIYTEKKTEAMMNHILTS